MDDFIDRPELTGTLISMEFGVGGRIGQMWVANPNLPDENEEFQFVLSPINMGDEVVEDYFPGTILLGARTHPDDPWIVSRNASAKQIDDEEDPSKVTFEYEFSFLEEIEAVGKFYEVSGLVPQVCWDLTLTNKSKTTIEIGELAFPFALNNLYEGYPATDAGAGEMYKDRVYIHKFVGGAASYLFAQRLNAEAPGLLVFPGKDTKWEFYNHVPASLNTPFRWEGIPVVYIHSQAAIEREEWKEWFNDHSSLILEPGESRTYQTKFVPTERDRFDSVNPILAACGQPAVRLLPGAVAPAEVGIAIEVTGATPTRFFSNDDAEMETDADEEGGFCFVKPEKAGLTTLSFEDTAGRESHTHLLFIEPIESLIKARAKWIVEKQGLDDPKSNLNGAIVPTDVHSGEQLTAPDDWIGPFGVESSLADALFLAQKNSIYPKNDEIAFLVRFVRDFLLDDLQNPADGTIGSSFADHKSVAMNAGRAQTYALAANFYAAISELEQLDLMPTVDAENRCLDLVLQLAPMLHWNRDLSDAPLLGEIRDHIERFYQTSNSPKVAQAYHSLAQTSALATRRAFPFGSNGGWSTKGYREVYEAIAGTGQPVLQEEAMRLAFAARSLSPSWWWYASDKRFLDESEVPHPGMHDKGEMCLGPTTVLNSLMFFRMLDRDYTSLPDSYLRLAFGGMLGIWALVRADGAGSMGFCPDAASKQFGISALSGDLGIGLYAYLRNVASYVLPTRNAGVVTFGCHFEMETTDGKDIFIVRPWDGVGRRIVVRQLGLEVRVSFGTLRELRFDSRKRWSRILLQNPSESELPSEILIKGLWGKELQCGSEKVQVGPDGAKLTFRLKPGETREIEIMVVE